MKTLISARVVRDLHAEGQTQIEVSPGATIVTAEARSIAAELGVRLIDTSQASVTAPSNKGTSSNRSGAGAGDAVRNAIRAQVQAKLPAGQVSDADLDGLIDKVLNESSEAGKSRQKPETQTQKHYQYQTIGGIKRIDAGSIDFGSFSGADAGSVGVADVITPADNSSMTAGYMTWTQCFFPWDLAHDEINVVLEGELHIRTDGQELICRAGDAVFIPKGSRLEIGTPTSTRFLYVTHPSLPKKA